MNSSIKRMGQINAYSEYISFGPDINNLTSTRILKIIKRGKGFIIRVLSFNQNYSLSIPTKVNET
jgi:hypothetical protein